MTRRTIFLTALLSSAIGMVLLNGCISIKRHTTADPFAIQHHTWWNYYQRGRLHLQAGNFQKARSDFETALGMRPGARYSYRKERWRARTYGMHTVEGYFPHRELGVCLFELNEPYEARALLETSMGMEPSARAKYYLNRIHEYLALASAPPPTLELAETPRWTTQRTTRLEGTAIGSNRISRLTINKKPEFIELAARNFSFQQELQLEEGLNEIEITVVDTAGKEMTANRVVTADWTPPEIHLQRNGPKLSITCKDTIGLAELQLNGQTRKLVGKEYTFDCLISQNEAFQMHISDLAGNRLDWALSSKELKHLAQHSEPSHPQLHIANAGKTITLYNNEYELDIRADDDTALRTVELNGTNLLARTTPLFRTLRRIPLIEGTNHVAVAVEDTDGNRTEKTITILRRQPEYLDHVYRLAALQSPVSGEITSIEFAQRMDQLTGYELTQSPVRFFLLASQKEGRKLQNEQQLSESKLADPRALLKQGKKLNADLVFITRVLSDAPGQTIYTQVLDATSGKELFIDDVYFEKPKEISRQISGLIMKIEQRFPLVRANVARFEKYITIDAGSENGVHDGMRFLIVHSDDSFEQGRVVRDHDHPAELVVSKVESETAHVIIPRGQPNSSAQPGDYVFSR